MMISELMTRDVTTVEPESTLRELASLLATEHISGAPVVAGEEVVGVVSAMDLLTFEADAPGSPTNRRADRVALEESAEAVELELEVDEGDESAAAYFADFWEDAGADVVERFEQLDGPEWNVLDEHVVSEIMSDTLFTLDPGTEVGEAARRMLEADVRRALIMEDGRLLGLVTSQDILRAVAENGLGS